MGFVEQQVMMTAYSKQQNRDLKNVYLIYCKLL